MHPVNDAERQLIRQQADLIAHHRAKAIEFAADESISNWHQARAVEALNRLREMALARVEGAAQ